MPSDVELVDDDVRLTGTFVVLSGSSVIARCNTLQYSGSPLALSTRDLFITWSIERANLHIGVLSVGVSNPVGDETDAGRHEPGHSVRVEGVVYADDLRLVSWVMTDPQALADQLEMVQEAREAAGLGDVFLDEDELQAELDEKSGQAGDVTGPRLDHHLADVDASERDRLPTLIEALRNQQPKLVRVDSSVADRLASIEARLDALARRP